MKTVNVNVLLKEINYEFKNKELLVTAITHPSFNDSSRKNNYERLEFLGDRVIGLIISRMSFESC